MMERMQLTQTIARLLLVGQRVQVGSLAGEIRRYIPETDQYEISFNNYASPHYLSASVVSSLLGHSDCFVPSHSFPGAQARLSSTRTPEDDWRIALSTVYNSSFLPASSHFEVFPSFQKPVSPRNHHSNELLFIDSALRPDQSTCQIHCTSKESKRKHELTLPSAFPFESTSQASTPNLTLRAWGEQEMSGVNKRCKVENFPILETSTHVKLMDINSGSSENDEVKSRMVAPSTQHHKKRDSARKPVSLSKQPAEASSNTKTQVFKKMHRCYKKLSDGTFSQTSTPNSSPQSNGSQTNLTMIPSYAEIEENLDTPININAARISTLRTRAIMTQTMQGLESKLPTSSDTYIVNCITSACPLCGRAIALNKLASCENWCKHLDLHGELGKQISTRFRAVEKCSSVVPQLDIRLANTVSWAHIKDRGDVAPERECVETVPVSLVPMTNKFCWQALVLSQLFLEGALLSSSVVCEELVSLGFSVLEIPFRFNEHFASLTRFQASLKKISKQGFETYLGEKSVENPYGLHPLAQDTPSSSGSGLVSYFREVKLIYERSGKVLSYREIESKLRQSGISWRTVNAARVVLLRRRHLLRKTTELCGKPTQAEACASCAVNAYITRCPFCSRDFTCDSAQLDCTEWIEHIKIVHGANTAAQQWLSTYVALARSDHAFNLPCQKLDLQFLPGDERVDSAPIHEAEVVEVEGVPCIPFTARLDWKALLFDYLLKSQVLSPSSVLTQELVVMGLFFFGLVNQRSPQKFGQYPQLQNFQLELHTKCSQAYDIYCGVGIKEGEIGSNHTRGKPINVTKSILQNYNHYGLSHKSLKRSTVLKS